MNNGADRSRFVAARIAGGIRAIAVSRRIHAPTVRQRTAMLLSLCIGASCGTATARACDWSNPGSAPYSRAPAAIAAAIERYQDIPAHARADLTARIVGLRDDGIVYIGRDGITSPHGTASNLRDMHWARGLCVGPVARSGWPADRVEPALLYCSAGHCVVVPRICGNVSRIDFVPRVAPMRRDEPVTVHHVPEPGSLFLSLLALAVMGRRK